MFRFRNVALVLAACAIGCGSTVESSVEPSTPRPTGYPQPGHLVVLLRQDNPYLRQTTALIAKTGNEREKNLAAAHLVALADHVGSDRWRASQQGVVGRMSRFADTSSGQRAAWIDELQKRHLVRVYDSMEALGTERVFDHCRAVWDDVERRPMQRKLALGVLASHDLAKKGPSDPWSMPTASSSRTGGSRAAVGSTQWPSPPTGTAPRRRADAPRVKGGTIVNVDQVVDTLRPYFKSCYLQALQQHGRFGAWIILVAAVRSDGTVGSVSGSGDDSVPHSMMACLRSVVAQARFAPPTGGSAVVEIPLAFTVDPNAPAR